MHPSRKWLYEYSITCLFEELYFLGIAKQEEINDLYHMFGHNCGLLGLLPQPIPREGGVTPSLQRREPMAAETPSFKGVIIHRKEGAVPSDDYLKKVIAEYDTCHVHMIVDDGAVVPLVQDNTIPSLDDIKTALTEFPQEAVLYFGKSNVKGGFSDDDMPPFEIIPNHLYCFIEGDLVNFQHPESEHSPAFFAVQEFLIDETKDLYERYSENIGEVMKVLDVPTVRKRFALSALKPRGSMILIGSNGQFLTISMNTDAALYGAETGKTWWTSNKLDYKEGEAAVETAAEPPVKESAVDRLKRIKAERDAAKKAPVDQKAMEQVTKPPKTDTAPAKDAPYMIMIPPNFDVKKKLGWIRDNLNLVIGKDGKPKMPEGWESAKGFPNTAFKPSSPLLEQNKSLANLDQVAKGAAKLAAEEIVTTIPINQRQVMYKDFLDKLTNDKLLSPDQIRSEADLNPDWNNQLVMTDGKDYDFIKTLFWPTNAFKKLGHTFYQGNICWSVSARNFILENMGKQVQEKLRLILEKEANQAKEAQQQQRAM